MWCDTAYNLTKFIILHSHWTEHCHWTFFTKKTKQMNICYAPNCAQFCNALKTSRNSNCPQSNEVWWKFFFLGKICQYHRKRVRDLQNSFLFAFRVLLKYIHNLEIKMFFQNSGNSFTLYCLIYAWLKFYVNIMRFSKAATQRGSLVKVFWKCAANLQETTHAEVWFQESCKAILMKPHLGMDVLL